MQQREATEPPFVVPVGETFWWSTDILRLIGAVNEEDQMVLFDGTPWRQTWQWTGGFFHGIPRYVRTG